MTKLLKRLLLCGLVSIYAEAPTVVAATARWNSGLQGEPRSVGRGGAGTVLSDDLWGVLENPAGSAMIVGYSLLQFFNNSITDFESADPNHSLNVTSGGIVIPYHRWGLAFGYSESNQLGQVREFTFSGAHRFLQDRLSLGVAFNLGSLNQNFAVGTTVGALYRLPKRVILGASFRTPLTYVEQNQSTFTHPWHLGVGVGYIPNRFFRAEVGIRLRGASRLGDAAVNYQPHIGFEYEFVNLRQLRVRSFVGSYLESERLHGTLGIGMDPWIFFVGLAVDAAQGYRNYLFAFGIDVGRIMKKLRIMPSSITAPPNGLFPDPLQISDDWFPPQLQDDPANAFQEVGPSIGRIQSQFGKLDQVVKGQPKAVQEEVESFSKDWNDIKEEIQP